MKFEEREREILAVLKAIPKSKDYLLVGGYAVNAYTLPRFSIDLDISLPKKELDYFRKMLEGLGYKKITNFKGLPYSGEFERFDKKVDGINVSMDLLINGVASRQTGAAYGFNYLKENSEIKEIQCRTGNAEARVADKAVLAALKINSARKTDIRDLFMLCREGVDAEKIKKHLERVPAEKVREHIAAVKEAIGQEQFKDSVQGVFGLVDEKSFRKAKKKVGEVLETIFDKY